LRGRIILNHLPIFCVDTFFSQKICYFLATTINSPDCLRISDKLVLMTQAYRKYTINRYNLAVKDKPTLGAPLDANKANAVSIAPIEKPGL